MTQLPTPKRFVIKPDSSGLWVDLFTDEAVAEFVNTLKVVTRVRYISDLKMYMVEIDPRYAFNEHAFEQTVAWLIEQLDAEFGQTQPPARRQAEA